MMMSEDVSSWRGNLSVEEGCELKRAKMGGEQNPPILAVNEYMTIFRSGRIICRMQVKDRG